MLKALLLIDCNLCNKTYESSKLVKCDPIEWTNSGCELEKLAADDGWVSPTYTHYAHYCPICYEAALAVEEMITNLRGN